MATTLREAFESGRETFNAHDVEGFAEVLADDVTFKLAASTERTRQLTSRARASCRASGRCDYCIWLDHHGSAASRIGAHKLLDARRFEGSAGLAHLPFSSRI